MAVDDKIVENEDEFTVIVEPSNPNDRCVGNTTIVISDNDGKYDIVGYDITIIIMNLSLFSYYSCTKRINLHYGGRNARYLCRGR